MWVLAVLCGTVSGWMLDSGGGGEVVYLADVLEEAGPSMVRRCWWDFGDWSDLCREWKAVPEEASFNVTLTFHPPQLHHP
jgi:Cell morphogenesis central region